MSKINDLWLVIKGQLSTALVEDMSRSIRQRDISIDCLRRELEHQKSVSIEGVKALVEASIVKLVVYDDGVEAIISVNELDQIRREASDKLTHEIIAKILAEDNARRHTEGKL